MHETIYAVMTGDDIRYIGKTVAELDSYWKHCHLQNCRNGIEKPLYEAMRAEGIDNFRIEYLDTTASGKTEHDYVVLATKAGHKLLNANSGNKAVAKKRSNFKREQDAALLRLELKEAAAKRRNILHNKAQALTKPEIVRQRILNEAPSAEELIEAERFPCNGLMLGEKYGKTAERAEYLRWGDVSIYIGYRKNDRERTMIVRRRDGAVLNTDKGWCRATPEVLLRNAAEMWASEFAWWKRPFED